jgi:hypothetical protein
MTARPVRRARMSIDYEDQTAGDDISNRFKECLEANIQAIHNHSETHRDCLAEQRSDSQPRP